MSCTAIRGQSKGLSFAKQMARSKARLMLTQAKVLGSIAIGSCAQRRFLYLALEVSMLQLAKR